MITRGVEWGPVGTWAGAIATVLVVITTALVALGYFDGFRGPRLRLTFEATEPWCRQGKTEGDGTALWVRVGVENLGAGPARGCLGRLISVTTNGELRPEIPARSSAMAATGPPIPPPMIRARRSAMMTLLPSPDAVAWRRGAVGERRTARLLAALERQGWGGSARPGRPW
jgi:hypothetical protein